MSERSAVQNPLIAYAVEIGWEYLPPSEAYAFRGGETGLYLYDLLHERLLALNPGVLNAGRVEQVIRALDTIPPTIEGNESSLGWMRGRGSVQVPEERRERNVLLIDFENPERNVYHVTEEWWQRGVVHRNRADVLFLINGIPVAIAETKGAGKRDGLEKGVAQIRRYHRETPELFVAAQVFEVTQLRDFFYGATWSLGRKNLFNWNDDVPGDYERRVKAFFDRERTLRMLRDYILFLRRNEELSKVVLRQHQARGVEKVIERIRDPERRHGLIWHTQGSGKTLTMITVAARILRESNDDDKPTVLMLVDRNELEQQMFGNLIGYGITSFEIAENKRKLRRLLAADFRGLLLSMIHKFDEIPADINTRSSIVVLVDEAHRSTGGDLGIYLQAALPNATFIGFTGTPVDNLAHGRGTFKTFGPDDPRGYLDKYSITESIADGTTVQLNYALAPSDMLVDRETLDREFLKLKEAEGISDVEELNAILRRAVVLKEMMKAPKRVEMIAAFTANHFQENVAPMGFKALFVAIDREACALYKKALDKFLPTEASAVIISGSANDTALLKEFHLDETAEKKIRNRFRKPGTEPRILIVTEKLLTGFDAPILYAMYLDKPMRDHVLLQAIARVNRPYEPEGGQEKKFGFVLDFVGIFSRLEDALAFDPDVVETAIQNIEVLKNLFATSMKEIAPEYLPLTVGDDDKAAERAIDAFADREKRAEFFKFFRRLETLYDVIAPDPFLREWVTPFRALAELYTLILENYDPNREIYRDEEFTGKVKDLIREYTTTTNIREPEKIHRLGTEELAALRDESSENVRILNLRKALIARAAAEGESKPYLLAIGEMAEAIAQAYLERQRETEQTLRDLEDLAGRAASAEERRRSMNLDEESFSIFFILEPYVPGLAPEKATEIVETFRRFPDFRWNSSQETDLRLEIYRILRPIAGTSWMAAANAVIGWMGKR